MTSMPWRSACFTDAAERAWAVPRLPRMRTSSIAAATSASVIHAVSAGESGVKLSPERLSLIESTPYFRNMRTTLRISSARVHVDAEAELGERQVRQRLVAEAAGHGDLLAGRQVARAGDLAGIDRVADHHVEPRLRAGGADARGPAGFEIAPGDLGAPQHVLLERHGLDAGERGRVVPREVRVGLAHAGHQRRAGAVDHGRAGGGNAGGGAARRGECGCLARARCRCRASARSRRGCGRW